ncbi:MAG: AAA family ATPase [Vicinamibacterales bacterium]
MTSQQPTTVLAISRQLGSGGSLIGQAVARKLGFHYVDRDLLHQAADSLGLDDADVAPFDERVESFWEHLTPLFLIGATGGPVMPPIPPRVSGSALFAAESGIIQSIAARENAVIVGRGGAHVLSGHPGVVSIFVHAPEPFRIERAMQTFETADREIAAELVRRSDRQRAAFHKSLTHREWTDASLYDLSVNTFTVGLEQATNIVTELVTGRVAASAKAKPL